VVGILPLYSLFFVAGFACYVGAIWQLRRYLRAEGQARLVLPGEACLHALAAVGLFLGRFDRLNSWDFVARPRAVAMALYHLIGGGPLLTLAAILIVIVPATAGSISFMRSFGRAVRRLRPLDRIVLGA
jgi:uncharacterized membrane protein